MSTLNSGPYFIKSAGAEKFIGRARVEYRSLQPKRILLRTTDGSEPPVIFKFELKKQGDTFEIATRGGAIASIDDKLYAVLMPEEPIQQWIIKDIPQQGQNKYLITTNQEDRGWGSPKDDPGAQIELVKLVHSIPRPLQLPHNQIWEIVPVAQ
ncbi:hypothetical protein CPB83DRAFT_837839 [Crepidotus variabilis]|uniref:Uncharacterized protein n=1 Tax=Crepidotus variabilis TaxID=179855 RepID=A0A9P6EBC4_9AGAR|nr:hypothetical protein CPB83DRAFT_837839 [Crepidotus variabilis]